MKKTLLATLLLLTSCGSIQMQPMDLGLQVEALGGLFKVKPQISIGDGKVGPSAIEVQFDRKEQVTEEVTEEETEVVVSDDD
tara:strand:+ start:115 stop:360 length:246 start_codon:yes stop_codon:yes gene_type:complete